MTIDPPEALVRLTNGPKDGQIVAVQDIGDDAGGAYAKCPAAVHTDDQGPKSVYLWRPDIVKRGK